MNLLIRTIFKFTLLILPIFIGCQSDDEQGPLPKNYNNLKTPELVTISGPLNPYGYPAVPKPAIIRSLVKNNDVSAIDSLCKLYDIKSRTDYRYEYHVRSILLSILQDPLAIVFIGKWENQIANSPYQKLAMSRYYIEEGWKARGYKFINEVSEENINIFINSMKTAQIYLDEALDIDPKVLYQWNLRFMVLMQIGDDQMLVSCINESLKINPYQALIRIQFQENCRPRWGGSYELMKAFIQECEPLIKHNAKLAAIKAILYDDIAFYQERNNKTDDAFATYQEGLNAAPYEASLYRSLGRLYFKKKDYESALENYKTAIKYDGAEVDDYVMCGQVSSMMTQGKSMENAKYYLVQTKEYIEKALLLDPKNKPANKLKKWYEPYI